MSMASNRKAMSPEISPTVEGHDADAALQSAYRDLGAGDLDGAESSFRHVLEITGERAKALNGLGIVASMRGHTGSAVSHYRQAIEIAPDYTLARDNLFQVLVVEGRRQAQSGKTGQAEATLDAAYELLMGDGGGEEQADARTSLEVYLDSTPASKLSETMFRHPIAGPMNVEQSLLFVTRHFDHHRRQISRIRRSGAFPA